MTRSYLDMMEDSLVRKLEIMEAIESENLMQKKILSDPKKVDGDAFDRAVDRKGELIDQLETLNDGFTTLFEQVKAEVGAHKEQYREQIGRMQAYIRKIMDLSSTLEAQEARNKVLADKYFSTAHTQLKEGQQRASVAIKYYQNINQNQFVAPQMFDNRH